MPDITMIRLTKSDGAVWVGRLEEFLSSNNFSVTAREGIQEILEREGEVVVGNTSIVVLEESAS